MENRAEWFALAFKWFYLCYGGTLILTRDRTVMNCFWHIYLDKFPFCYCTAESFFKSLWKITSKVKVLCLISVVKQQSCKQYLLIVSSWIIITRSYSESLENACHKLYKTTIFTGDILSLINTRLVKTPLQLYTVVTFCDFSWTVLKPEKKASHASVNSCTVW